MPGDFALRIEDDSSLEDDVVEIKNQPLRDSSIDGSSLKESIISEHSSEA